MKALRHLDLDKFNFSSTNSPVITGTSAVRGDGLYEGLDWLAAELSGEQAKKTLVAPVEKTVKEVSETSHHLSSTFHWLTSWWTQRKTTENTEHAPQTETAAS